MLGCVFRDLFDRFSDIFGKPQTVGTLGSPEGPVKGLEVPAAQRQTLSTFAGSASSASASKRWKFLEG